MKLRKRLLSFFLLFLCSCVGEEPIHTNTALELLSSNHIFVTLGGDDNRLSARFSIQNNILTSQHLEHKISDSERALLTEYFSCVMTDSGFPLSHFSETYKFVFVIPGRNKVFSKKVMTVCVKPKLVHAIFVHDIFPEAKFHLDLEYSEFMKRFGIHDRLEP